MGRPWRLDRYSSMWSLYAHSSSNDARKNTEPALQSMRRGFFSFPTVEDQSMYTTDANSQNADGLPSADFPNLAPNIQTKSDVTGALIDITPADFVAGTAAGSGK